MRPARLVLVVAVAAAALGATGLAGAVDRAGDGRWARAIVLQKRDLPSFRAEPPLATRTCLPGRLDGQTAFARSAHFSSGTRSVTARAWIFPEERHAKGGFRNLVGLDYAGCLRRSGVVGARILSISQKVIGGVQSGDRFRGVRVTVRLRQSGTTFPVYVEIFFVRNGRAVADAAFTSSARPFGIAAETAAVGKMSARMQRPPKD
jgi:hypothetical protein